MWAEKKNNGDQIPGESRLTVTAARSWGISRLTAAAVSRTPALDCGCILEHILGKSRTFLMAHGDTILTPDQTVRFRDGIERRLTGLPVAYITGHKEFYGYDFLVTPDVLIPKPDTELLVEQALAFLSRNISGFRLQNENRPFRIADICTGSGCIAISVLNGFNPGKTAVSVTAADLSSAALAVAEKNAGRLLSSEKQSEIAFLQGDLMEPFDTAAKNGKESKFDLILSNPPYIPGGEVDTLLADGRSEPRLALDGDAGGPSDDGLAIIRRLVSQAFNHLVPGGLFLVETGEYNAEATAELMKEAGFDAVATHRDLAGQLRLTQGIRA